MPARKFYKDPELAKKLGPIALAILTAGVFAVWFALLKPFIPVLALAMTLSIIAFPLYLRISRRISNTNVAAGVTVLLLAILIVGPLTFTFRELARIGGENAVALRDALDDNGGAEKLVSRSLPREAVRWIDRSYGIKKGIEDIAGRIAKETPQLFTASIWSFIQLTLILFTSFFFFRDKDKIFKGVMAYLPLSNSECEKIFKSIDDTVHATIYGKVVCSGVQGALGGFMFWMLDLPAPVLWGLIMALMALIPYLGAPTIWGPAAIYLIVMGDWEKAVILTLWGTLVIGLIDNILYPFLVGQRVRLHTLSLFFFILGGFIVFGASGIVLGPIFLAVGQSLLFIWKERLP